MATDELIVIFKLIDQMTVPLSNVEKKLALVDKQIRLTQKLAGLGLVLGKRGGIKDAITGGYVTPLEIARRKFNQLEKTAIDATNKMKNRFDMNTLSLLFFGMAIQRFFGGMLRSLFNTFNKAEGNTSALAKATVALNASWEYLKFTIFNALNQPIIIDFIMGIIDAVNGVADWVQQNEDLVDVLISVVGLLAIIGGILLTYGTLKLGFKALKYLFIDLTNPVFLTIAAIVLLIVTFILLEDQLSDTTSILDSFKGILSGLWDIVVGIFTGDWDKIKLGFIKIWAGILTINNNCLVLIIQMFVNAGAQILDILTIIGLHVIKEIGSWFTGAEHSMDDFYDDIRLISEDNREKYKEMFEPFKVDYATIEKDLEKAYGLLDQTPTPKEFLPKSKLDDYFQSQLGVKEPSTGKTDVFGRPLTEVTPKTDFSAMTMGTEYLNDAVSNVDDTVTNFKDSINANTQEIMDQAIPIYNDLMNQLGIEDGENLLTALDKNNKLINEGTNTIIPAAIKASGNISTKLKGETNAVNITASAWERLNRARHGATSDLTGKPQLITTVGGLTIDINSASSTYGVI